MLENEKLTNDDFDNIDRNFCLDKGRLTKSTFSLSLFALKLLSSIAINLIKFL